MKQSTLSRRSFLKASAAFAGWSLLPSNVWANPPSKRFTTAHIGIGGMGGIDLKIIASHPAVQVVGVQPDGESSIPGIRKWPEAYLPTIFDRKRVDRVVEVSTRQAEDTMRDLAKIEGVFCGPSSGGSVWTALQLCRELSGATIAAIICDRGDRYISTGVFPE